MVRVRMRSEIDRTGSKGDTWMWHNTHLQIEKNQACLLSVDVICCMVKSDTITS